MFLQYQKKHKFLLFFTLTVNVNHYFDKCKSYEILKHTFFPLCVQQHKTREAPSVP